MSRCTRKIPGCYARAFNPDTCTCPSPPVQSRESLEARLAEAERWNAELSNSLATIQREWIPPAAFDRAQATLIAKLADERGQLEDLLAVVRSVEAKLRTGDYHDLQWNLADELGEAIARAAIHAAPTPNEGGAE